MVVRPLGVSFARVLCREWVAALVHVPMEFKNEFMCFPTTPSQSSRRSFYTFRSLSLSFRAIVRSCSRSFGSLFGQFNRMNERPIVKGPYCQRISPYCQRVISSSARARRGTRRRCLRAPSCDPPHLLLTSSSCLYVKWHKLSTCEETKNAGKGPRTHACTHHARRRGQDDSERRRGDRGESEGRSCCWYIQRLVGSFSPHLFSRGFPL